MSHDQLVRSTLRYVDEHLDARLSLSALSKRTGVSVSHLVRVVTTATGVSPARRVRLLRLKRASMQIAFNPRRSITDIALGAGFQNPESFSRAFKRAFGQSPRAFKRRPAWKAWRNIFTFQQPGGRSEMDVRIVEFPETRVAAIEHRGAPDREYDTARTFIEWRIANRVPPDPDRHRTYGIHYTDPRTTPAGDHRMDICVSFDRTVAANPRGLSRQAAG